MDDKHRRAIKHHWGYFVNYVVSEQMSCIMDYLLQSEIVSWKMYEHVMSEKEPILKGSKLLTLIQKREPLAFGKSVNEHRVNQHCRKIVFI